MKRIQLLRNQLTEAVRFVQSTEPDYHRLGLILLDNFIEIQLMVQVEKDKGSFYFEKILNLTAAEIERAKKSFPALLELSMKLDIVEKEYVDALKFCHELRNKLFHETIGYLDLLEIANCILLEIIKRKQPIWGSGRTFVVYEDSEIYNMRDLNSEESWQAFLDDLISIDTSRVITLLYQSLANRINAVLESYENIKTDFVQIVHRSKSNKLNDILRHYAFYDENDHKLKKYIHKSADSYNNKLRELLLVFNQKWNCVDKSDLLLLLKDVEKIKSKNSLLSSFQEYLKYHNLIDKYYSAIQKATSDYDQAVQHAIKSAKER